MTTSCKNSGKKLSFSKCVSYFFLLFSFCFNKRHNGKKKGKNNLHEFRKWHNFFHRIFVPLVITIDLITGRDNAFPWLQTLLEMRTSFSFKGTTLKLRKNLTNKSVWSFEFELQIFLQNTCPSEFSKQILNVKSQDTWRWNEELNTAPLFIN